MTAVGYDPNDFDKSGEFRDVPAPPALSLFFGAITLALLGVLFCCWLGYL